MRMVIFKLF